MWQVMRVLLTHCKRFVIDSQKIDALSAEELANFDVDAFNRNLVKSSGGSD